MLCWIYHGFEQEDVIFGVANHNSALVNLLLAGVNLISVIMVT